MPIASEVEHVRNYLFIQQLRHGEEYQYEVAVDSDILDKYIPGCCCASWKMIYHGILQANRQGRIEILRLSGIWQRGHYL